MYKLIISVVTLIVSEAICQPTYGPGRLLIEQIPQAVIHETQNLYNNDIEQALKIDELHLRRYAEDKLLPELRKPRSIESSNLNEDQSRTDSKTKHYRTSLPVFAPTRPWFTPPIYYIYHH
ncbi:hypothetical protein RR48_14611 [Papilio machaon]|uniref:Uncharacterized protein n=1 Tax=Papilio machaon TaxID=76193 RepID=A0A194QLB5_PAPMA|nr:hypothetical protein RR48_14611 [Papilio machaon]